MADIKIKGIQGEKGDSPIKGKDYFTDAEIAEFKKDIESRIELPKNGYTPLKGIDYYTDEDKQELIDTITPLVPKGEKGDKGDKGDMPEVEYGRIIEDVISLIPEPKNGQDGSPDTPEEIVAKIASLDGDDRLSFNSLKDRPTFKGNQIGYLRELSDVAVDNEPTNGYVLAWNSTTKSWTAVAQSGGGGSVAWGDITGTLSNQTDLQTVLDAKLDVSAFNLSTFDTDDLSEGTNLYFTNERAQDAVGTILVGSSEIDFTYNDATPSITASLVTGSIDETKLDTSVNASLDLADSALQSGDNISELTNDVGYISSVTGDWTGTFDGQEGTYYLARANHTGTQTASTISDFDTEVSNNTDVAANTSARHNAVTVTDSSEIDFTLTGQNITASLVTGSIDESKLDTSVNASLDLADSAAQSGDNISIFTNDSGYITSVSGGDHGTLAGLTDDDHTQYALLAGRSGGQTLLGGGSGDNIVIRSNSSGNGLVNAGNVFYVDETNGRVGIFKSDPEVVFHSVADGEANLNYYDSYGVNNQFVGRQAQGTLASPTATQENNILFAINGRGHDGTNFTTTRGLMAVEADENYTGSAQGTRIVFDTTENGTTNRTEKMRLDHNGNLGLGTTNPTSKFEQVLDGAIISDTDFTMSRYGAGGTTFIGQAAGGTVSSPTALTDGNNLFIFQGRGYDGTTMTSSANGRIRIIADGNWSGSNTGAYMTFDATDNGSTTRTNGILTIRNSAVGINTTNPSGADLDINGTYQAANQYIYLRETTGGDTISTSPTDVTWDTQDRVDSLYTHSTSTNSEQITIGEAGDYEIHFEGTATNSSATRQEVKWELLVDTGAGFTSIAGSDAFSYHRISGVGQNTASITKFYTASAGDIIKVQATASGASVTVVGEGTRINIKRL